MLLAFSRVASPIARYVVASPRASPYSNRYASWSESVSSRALDASLRLLIGYLRGAQAFGLTRHIEHDVERGQAFCRHAVGAKLEVVQLSRGRDLGKIGLAFGLCLTIEVTQIHFKVPGNCLYDFVPRVLVF